MKISKVLFGSAVLAALVFGFAGCSSEDDDDDNSMISGSNNNYSINYDNSASTETSRGYNTTSTKHLGSICQITFSKDSLNKNGAMSYIWDLQSVASGDPRAAKDVRRFCIAGLSIFTENSKYYANPYVSYYTDVVDIQAVNFGTGKASTATEGTHKGISYTAKETALIAIDSRKDTALIANTDGSVTVTIKVEPVASDGTTSKSKATKFAVDFYAGAYDENSIALAASFASTTISAKDLGYKASTDGNYYLKQQSAAVYANVYAHKKLSGTWKYVKDYAEAEVVEE